MERWDTVLSGQLAEYEHIAKQVRAMRDGIEDIRGTAYSDDGLITAVVGGRGELRELELDPRIYREHNASALAARIVETVRSATEEAERELTTFAEKLVPPNERGDDFDPRFDPAIHALDNPKAVKDRL